MSHRRTVVWAAGLLLLLLATACSGDDTTSEAPADAGDTTAAPDAADDEPAVTDATAPDAAASDDAAADDATADDGEDAADDTGETTVVQIGHLGNLTGGAASLGVPYSEGIQLAVEEINASGVVEGVTFELVTEDTGSDPTNAVTIFNQFVQDGIPVTVSDGISQIALAVGPVANDAEVAFVTGAGSGSPEEDFEFHLSDIATQYAELAPVLVEEGGPRVAAILGTDNPAFPLLTDNLEAGLDEAGGEMVLRESFEPGTTDFSAALTNVQAADPDVVFVVALADTAGNIIAQMQQVGGFDDVLVTVQSGIDRTVFDIAGPAAEGVILRPAYSAGTPGSEEFVDLYQQAYDALPDTNSAFGWDTAWMIATATQMALADGEEITGEALRSRIPAASTSAELDERGVIPDLEIEASGTTFWPGVPSTFNSDGDIVAVESL